MEFERLGKKKRKLSKFICLELLYDYETNQLDAERREAMRDFLPTCEDSQRELQYLQAGINYTQSLAQAQLLEVQYNELQTTTSRWELWQERLSWRKLPDTTRWSIEALTVSLIVAVLAYSIPWSKLTTMLPSRSQEIVLSEVEKQVTQTQPNLPAPVVEGAKNEPTAKPEVVAKSNNVAAKAVPATTPLPTSMPAPRDSAASEEAADSESMAQAGSEIEPATENKKKIPKGFVYRAFISVAEIEAATDRVRVRVLELGGKKAGQVELGWRKPSGSYFHFTLPESNYEALVETLRSFGPVRIYKDPHSRVMPEGEIRLILEIEDTGPTNEQEAPSP